MKKYFFSICLPLNDVINTKSYLPPSKWNISNKKRCFAYKMKENHTNFLML